MAHRVSRQKTWGGTGEHRTIYGCLYVSIDVTVRQSSAEAHRRTLLHCMWKEAQVSLACVVLTLFLLALLVLLCVRLPSFDGLDLLSKHMNLLAHLQDIANTGGIHALI